jgi:hypothetical protein
MQAMVWTWPIPVDSSPKHGWLWGPSKRARKLKYDLPTPASYALGKYSSDAWGPPTGFPTSVHGPRLHSRLPYVRTARVSPCA